MNPSTNPPKIMIEVQFVYPTTPSEKTVYVTSEAIPIPPVKENTIKKSRKPFEWTPARQAAFERCREARQKNLESKKKSSEGTAPSPPVEEFPSQLNL